MVGVPPCDPALCGVMDVARGHRRGRCEGVARAVWMHARSRIAAWLSVLRGSVVDVIVVRMEMSGAPGVL